jgi:hypothetical protein
LNGENELRKMIGICWKNIIVGGQDQQIDSLKNQKHYLKEIVKACSQNEHK